MKLARSLRSPAVQRALAAVVGAIAIFAAPQLFATLLRYFVAVGAVVFGGIELLATYRERAWRRGALGLLSVAAGLALLFGGDDARRLVGLTLGVLFIARGLRAFGDAVTAYRDPDGDPFWAGTLSLMAFALGAAIFLIPGAMVQLSIVLIGTAWFISGVVVLVNGFRSESEDVPDDLIGVIKSNSMAADLRRQVTESVFAGWDTSDGALRFAALMSFATAIATYGVKADSTAVVIGAMLIAPLMSPIMALSASILMGWPVRAARSAARVGVGVLIGVGGSFVLSLTSPEFVAIEANTQVLSRIAPTLLDLLIALAAGAAGGYAMTHPTVGNSLPGVAIAVALAPPLAVVGVSLESGEFLYAGGALLLFLTNLVGIVIASGVAYIVSGYSPWSHVERSGESGRRSLALVGISLALIVLPLALIGDQIVNAAAFQNRTEQTVDDWLGPDTEFAVAQVRIRGSEVNVVIVGAGEPPDPEDLAAQLAETLDDAIVLELDVIPEKQYRIEVVKPPRTSNDSG